MMIMTAEKITSFDSRTVGQGNVIKEVLFAFNDFRQATDCWQSHDDPVDQHDGLHRLADMQRGRLNTQKDAIESGTLAFRQQWQLDETGNWPNFKEDEDGDQAWDLVQDRNLETEI